MTTPRRSSAPIEPDPSIFQHLRSGAYRSSYDGASWGRNQQTQTIDIGSPRLANQHQRVASDETKFLSPVSNSATFSNEVDAVDIEANAGAEAADNASQPAHPLANRRNPNYDLFKTISEDYKMLENGIPRLGGFLHSNDSFDMHRQFATEASEHLVAYQIEIHLMSAEIREMQKRYARPGEETNSNLWSTRNPDPDYKEKIQERLKLLITYYDLLLKYNQVKALEKVADHDYTSVRKWMGMNFPLGSKEERYLYVKEDFVAILGSNSGNRNSKLEGIIKQKLAEWNWPWVKFMLRDKRKDAAAEDPAIFHGSSARLSIAAKIGISLLAISIMLAPVLVIFLCELSRALQAAIVAVFLAACVAVMVVMEELTEHTLFLCIAAYGAILVAILGNVMSRKA
ncbi:hypothetical protein GLAREA_01435 [Glarea lozoyensis ATCC 20868]|uniref:DUF6594 domain-containing protein n=1 Tax=Glarea lozoyensis (strain ATCC 20868 / MF5171) TaxID=1116229 RepID=S3DFV1_GLAL2|nr:uncharacterized protein GLAREA_01435 [Glarea lozoyensis ATCC 20868]EPE25523.1 hypothetical protein GLAREA_01435 [Glarea lozoyensis ATCC 20868]